METQLPPVKILTDDIEDNPILDFEEYAKAIVKMIKGSSNFSIGIYGEWGTGKTTLMRLIKNNLASEDEILTIWFNAWRYEREEQFALLSLMKTIAYKMDEQPKYDKAKQVLFKSIITVSKGLASKYIFSDRYVDELQKNLDSKMKSLAQADKDTIYFHGLKQIEDTMNDIRNDSPNSRIVVFIDDLDRCSPKKALEVFESIKVFLGITGFIYIIGLSHETIAKLIAAEYEKSGITGDQYIKKIIQIPVTIPEWNDNDVEKLIDNLPTKLDSMYKDIVVKNKEVIAKAVELNPREVKRFINNFILAHEIYSNNSKVETKELLVVQALKVRWNKFYSYISFDEEEQFREEVKKCLEMKEDERNGYIGNRGKDNNNPLKGYEKKVFEFKSEDKLWEFLERNKDTIFNIKDWKVYRRAVESIKEIPVPDDKSSQLMKDSLLKLLQSGNISEFNKQREQSNFAPLSLRGSKLLSGAYLQGAYLQGAYLQGANLWEADLREANLQGANLCEANLQGANLREADLRKADLREANLQYGDLWKADLREAILWEADLQSANLSGAKLERADLRKVKNLPIIKEEAQIRGANV